MGNCIKKPLYDVSSQAMDAMERSNLAEVASNCFESRRSESNRIMTQLVSRDQWDAVKHVIRCVGDEERTWDIEGVLVKNDILLSVAEGNWRRIGEMPHERFLHSTLEWILQQACTRAKQTDIVQYVLPHCEDDRLDSVLTTLVERRQWRAVGVVLKRGVSDSVKRWAVIETCKHYTHDFSNMVDDGNLIIDNPSDCESDYDDGVDTCNCPNTDTTLRDIMSHCADDNYMFDVGNVIIDSPSDCESDDDDGVDICDCPVTDTLRDIVSHCADDQLDDVLDTLATRGLWGAVVQLFRRGVSDSQRQSLIEKACTLYKEAYIILYVLHHTHEDQQDVVLKILVKRGMWTAVESLFGRGVSENVKQWACSCFSELFITECLLCHCADDQLDSVLTTLVERRLWLAVVQVLKRGVSDSVKRWAVEKTCQYCKKSYHVDNVDNYIVKYILSHCADDQLDSVLTTLVERHLWQAVGEVLKRGVSDSVKRWAVETTCQHCEKSYHVDNVDNYIVKYILSHCADDQLDNVLTTLVERRLWLAVGEVLKRGVSDSVKRWAVETTCQNCEKSYYFKDADTHIANHILPYCADDQLDSVLTILLERNLWGAVLEMLQRDVSDCFKRWAVAKACVACHQHFITQYILPHCADDQLDSVLIILMERQFWLAVEKVLKRGVSDSVIRCAMAQACVATDETINTKHILPHCADDQLDSVLTTLVERRLWRSAQHVLERVAGDFNKDLAGQETCEHCKSAGVYFSEYRVHAPDSHATNTCTHHCADGSLDSPTSALTTRDECTAVRNMSGRQVSDVQRRENIKAAFLCADENSLIENILPHYVYDSVHSALKMLALRGFCSAFLLFLHNCIIDTLSMWAFAKDTALTYEVFCDMVRNPCDRVKGLTPAMWRSVTWSGLQRFPKQLLDWDTPLCEVLCDSLLAIGKEVWLSGREGERDVQERVMKEAVSTVEHLHQQIAPVIKSKTNCVSDLLLCLECLRHEYPNRRSGRCFLLQLYIMKNIVHQYYKRKAWTQMTDAILIILTTVPVVPDVQSVALSVMLRHKRWDVIRHACLSGVCEQDRRQLFQAAVKQRQWSAVKRWADHTLYDDQRLWALGEARQEKRWDVYLKLADHGLSEWERVGVLFRVAMHADWKLVRHMLRTVADVTDMIDLLTNTPGTLAKLGAQNYEQRMNELKVFENNLKKDTNTLRTLKTMAKRGKWWVVLHNIRHKPNLQHARRALKVVVSNEAWHAVMLLVKLETDVTRRDSLFRDMVRLRQWAVCRELLEQGVSQQLRLELLSKLKEHSQWTLVAMVMECAIDDATRKKIMHQAMMMREGSVVWECINKLQTRLSGEEREDMFHLAFNREVWQAVKPLIEEKDMTGIRHRDTALLEAIEQHQWDVVDHCQRHHADINMKDDDGHTPIHRAARKGDWEAVKELTVRDGDPNLLDSEGLSVLHRAIRAEQWDAVKLLIQFHGDIHQAKRNGSTPLQMLIDARQGEVIESSLMWCPDQQKGVNDNRETVLHAVCLSGLPGALYYLIARKVDPLAVTTRRHTALCYAVLCKDCPQRMVAECIQMGFSSYQPHITEAARTEAHFWYYDRTEPRMFMSPVMLAVIRGLTGVTQMLYESGACSSRELFEFSECVSDLTDDARYTETAFHTTFNELWRKVYHNDTLLYSFDKERMQKSADYLREMCSTPRSLVSTCRLVISRCLTLRKRRHRDIAQLPLSPKMKDYLMFSDLTDPRYPDLSYRGKK